MNNIISKILVSLLAVTVLIFAFPKFTYGSFFPGLERCDPDHPGVIGVIACEAAGLTCSGIDTAIGCIPLEIGISGSDRGTETFTTFMLRWASGLGGGIAFILIVYAGFMITSSAGDPKRLQAGKELLTAAVSGLLMLIFAVFILRIIGVDILGLENIGL